MEKLEAKLSALETVHRLAFALDALDYNQLAELFYPDRKFNFDIFAILKTPPKDVTPREYFDIAIGGLGGYDATQHVLSNPIVSLDGRDKAHVKTMVTAFHGIVAGGNVEGATARVIWQIDLEHDQDRWFIVKWAISGMVPIDHPDVFARGHKLAHDGKLRPGIVMP